MHDTKKQVMLVFTVGYYIPILACYANPTRLHPNNRILYMQKQIKITQNHDNLCDKSTFALFHSKNCLLYLSDQVKSERLPLVLQYASLRLPFQTW
jgi:hypothetical protein